MGTDGMTYDSDYEVSGILVLIVLLLMRVFFVPALLIALALWHWSLPMGVAAAASLLPAQTMWMGWDDLKHGLRQEHLGRRLLDIVACGLAGVVLMGTPGPEQGIYAVAMVFYFGWAVWGLRESEA